MQCEKCGNNSATVFAKIGDDFGEELYVCSECFQERKNKHKLGIKSDFQDCQKVCVCKMTLDEILQSGYVGCEKCYKTFEQELLPIVKKIHGKISHTGKIMLSKIERLEMQIQKAIDNNFFELAEKLKNDLKALKEKGDEWF